MNDKKPVNIWGLIWKINKLKKEISVLKNVNSNLQLEYERLEEKNKSLPKLEKSIWNYYKNQLRVIKKMLPDSLAKKYVNYNIAEIILRNSILDIEIEKKIEKKSTLFENAIYNMAKWIEKFTQNKNK